MRVIFMEDYGQDENGDPLYVKGEIVWMDNDFAQVLIAEGYARSE